MKDNLIQDHWNQLKGMILQRWEKFTPKELEGAQKDLKFLVPQIQKIYGYGRDHAEREFRDFLRSLRPVFIDPSASAQFQ